MPKGFLVNSHKHMMTKDNVTEMKSVRYMPPLKEEQVNRMEEHIDGTTFTFQVYGDLEGLEVKYFSFQLYITFLNH